ncbi:catalase, partial [Pseudomonas aeruginosa]
VKFHWTSLRGQQHVDPDPGADGPGRGSSPLTNDLVSEIPTGDFPKWGLYIQVLKPEELATYALDPMDATKIWAGIPERTSAP